MKKPNPFLRVILFPVAAVLSLGSFAFADDAKTVNNAETTHDVSKNPLTGNTTHTTTTESEVKVGSVTKKSKSVRKGKFNKHGEKVESEADHKTETKKED